MKLAIATTYRYISILLGRLNNRRLLHKGESLCCFRDSALVTYGGMLPSGLTLSALRFILSAKSVQSCEQDCETVDFCNSLNRILLYISVSIKKGTLSQSAFFMCFMKSYFRTQRYWECVGRGLHL